jgi:hypothetical protein
MDAIEMILTFLMECCALYVDNENVLAPFVPTTSSSKDDMASYSSRASKESKASQASKESKESKASKAS